VSIKKIFILYTAILVLLAVLPINGGDSAMNHTFILSVRLDYLLHFAIFVPWMMLVWIFSGVRFSQAPMKAFGWIMAGFVLASFTEMIQYFLPFRSFNINDLVANLLGVAIGAVFFLFRRPDIISCSND
jgi:glycopeptide antibiotics resistance protein